MMPDQPHHLDYGLPSRKPLLLGAAAVLGFLLCAALSVPMTAAFARYLHLCRVWQDCAAFKPPEGLVAYANTPMAAIGVGLPPGCSLISGDKRMSLTGAPPGCWAEMEKIQFGHSGHDALLYLGSRWSPSGHERLVAIELPSYPPDFVGFPSLISRSVIQRPALRQPRLAMDASASSASDAKNELPGNGDSLTIYVGHDDPADASRFVIPYSMGKEKGFIQGSLTDQGTVALDYDSGPGRADWR